MLQAIENKHFAYQKWLTTKEKSNMKNYIDQKESLNKMISKNEEWEVICTNISAKPEFQQLTETWSVIRKMSKNNNNKK